LASRPGIFQANLIADVYGRAAPRGTSTACRFALGRGAALRGPKRLGRRGPDLQLIRDKTYFLRGVRLVTRGQARFSRCPRPVPVGGAPYWFRHNRADGGKGGAGDRAKGGRPGVTRLFLMWDNYHLSGRVPRVSGGGLLLNMVNRVATTRAPRRRGPVRGQPVGLQGGPKSGLFGWGRGPSAPNCIGPNGSE